MKKILGLIVSFAFLLSIICSSVPGINAKVRGILGKKAYASTSLPLPPSIGIEKNLAHKSK